MPRRELDEFPRIHHGLTEAELFAAHGVLPLPTSAETVRRRLIDAIAADLPGGPDTPEPAVPDDVDGETVGLP